jgi:radical SAM superfamily enzyme YgiQ (UPF0313 family)
MASKTASKSAHKSSSRAQSGKANTAGPTNLLAGERGYQWRPKRAQLPVLMVFPNVYYLGMSNLGFQYIYREIDSHPGCSCERSFMPDNDTDTPRSLESGKPWRDFPLICISAVYEIDYGNILRLLERAGLPRLAADRGEDAPLILVGGPAASANPEPLAAYVDLVVIGEGEVVIHELMDALQELRAAGLSKHDILKTVVQRVPGVYAPRFYGADEQGAVTPTEPDVPFPIAYRRVDGYDRFDFGSAIITPNTEFKDVYLVELTRGCGQGCRFCLAGFLYRPVRYPSLQRVIETIEKGRTLTPKIGLMGAAVSDYPHLYELADYLAENPVDLSVSSVRADNIDHRFVRMLKNGGIRSLTLAPEAGSLQLRKMLNKNISDEELVNAVECAAEGGLDSIKLYSMIGVPSETMADIEGLVQLVAKLVHTGRPRGIKHFNVGVSSWTPKALVPLQWAAQDTPKNLETKVRYLEKAMARLGAKLRPDSWGWAQISGALARGDRRVGRAIGTAVDLGYSLGAWKRAFNEHGLDAERLWGARNPEIPTPWAHVTNQVEVKHLAREYKAFNLARATPICNVGICRMCGVC